MHEPAPGARCFSSRLFYFLVVVSAAAWFMASQAQAQTSWVYTETQNAKTPIRCVQKSDLTWYNSIVQTVLSTISAATAKVKL